MVSAAAEIAPPTGSVPASAPPRRRRGVIDVRMLLSTLLAFTGFCMMLAALTDYDYWWQLASGRYIVTYHRLPVPDPFSFTEHGRTWVAHEWLSEVVMYLLHHAFGVIGPLVLFGLCAAAMILLTLSTLHRLGTRLLPSVFWTAVMIAALHPFSNPRPQVAAFALMAAVIWLIERWIERRDHSIWALPAVFCLWGNVHGSFAIGLAVPALVLLGETAAARSGWSTACRLGASQRRQLAAVLVASVGAVAINPNGFAILWYPFTKFDNPLLKYLGEWGATSVGSPSAWPFVLLAGGYVALVVVRRPALPAADLLLAAAMTLAGLWAVRFTPFAAASLAALIGRVLTLPNRSGVAAPRALSTVLRWREERSRYYAVLTPMQQAMTAAVLLSVLVFAKARIHPYNEAADSRLPVKAVDTLGADGLSGNLFNNFNWGGYLIWRLGPADKVFIDGRGDDLYMTGGVLRQYLDVIYGEADAEAVLDKYDIQSVLFLRDAPLTRYLLATGRWRPVYDDGATVKLDRVYPAPTHSSMPRIGTTAR